MTESLSIDGPDFAAQTTELHKQLKRWASNAGVDNSKIAGDLAEIQAAAVAISRRIERLAFSTDLGVADSRKVLVEIQAWLYEEMKDHMDSLRSPLSQAVDVLYEKGA